MKLSTKIKLTKVTGYIELVIALTIWVMSLFVPTASLFWLATLYFFLLAVVGFIFAVNPKSVLKEISKI